MFLQKTHKPLTKGIASVTVVMQLETLECGASSLAMILAYFGLWIPLEQLRTDCGVSRDGSSLKNIYRAAQKYSLIPAAFKYDAETLRNSAVTYPCIVFWEYNHFVVLDGFKKDKVFLNDPARGKITITFEEFSKSYSGVCMSFKPGKDFKPEGKPDSIFTFTDQRLTGSMPALLMVILTTLIASMAGIVLPAFSRFFVDHLLTYSSPQWAGGFFILLGLVILSQVLSLLIKAVYLLRLQGKMAAVANSSLLWHILRLPIEFFEQRMAGDIVTRQQSNQKISYILINTLTPLLLDFVTMVFNLLIMINYSPILALVGVAAVLINMILARLISEKRINITRVQMRDMVNLNGVTVTGIDMIETIKSSGAENGFFTHWAGFQANANNQAVKFAKLNQTLGQIPPLVYMLMSNLTLFFGIRLIIRGEWTIGLVSAFTGYFTAFSNPAAMLINAGQQLQEMRSHMEHVQDVFKYPVAEEHEDILPDTDLGKLSGLVEMKNVTFGYNKLAELTLRNFSMRAEPGKSIAIVGPSGCGKSTVAKLLTGLYSAWEGDILFDGKPINQIPRSIFTGSVASVTQDITLFEDTIANNIRMWDKSIENFEVILAARDAVIHDDIIEREEDYSALVSEGGRNFSGGQRQKIEIAGVLAQDPKSSSWMKPQAHLTRRMSTKS